MRPTCTISDELGNILLWTADAEIRNRTEPHKVGIYKSKLKIPGHFLSPGVHSFTVALNDSGEFYHSFAQASNVVRVNVEDDLNDIIIRGAYKESLPGFIRPKMIWESTR
jgi:hypothetical protein